MEGGRRPEVRKTTAMATTGVVRARFQWRGGAGRRGGSSGLLGEAREGRRPERRARALARQWRQRGKQREMGKLERGEEDELEGGSGASTARR